MSYLPWHATQADCAALPVETEGVGKCCNCGQERYVGAESNGDLFCAPCKAECRQQTRGFPDCPTCRHRLSVMEMRSIGWYRCVGCGAKFTRGDGRVSSALEISSCRNSLGK